MLHKPVLSCKCRFIVAAILFAASACAPDQHETADQETAYAGEQSLYQIDGVVDGDRVDLFVTPLVPFQASDTEQHGDRHHQKSTVTVENDREPGNKVGARAVEALPLLPVRAFGSGVQPTGTDYTALVQGVRVEEFGWDRANCGIVPTSGVCAQLMLRNMYPGHRARRLYFEFTRLTPTPPTTTVTFDSNISGDPALGTSDAIGLLRYPNLERALDPGDRAFEYWVFRSPDPAPVLFTFSGVVKGELR